MYDNTSRTGIPGVQQPTQPSGVSPAELDSGERESLRGFAVDVTNAVESYLPDEFMVESMYRTTNGVVALDIRIACPNGSMIQSDIQPTPKSSANLTDSEKETQNQDIVTDLSQNLAAAAIQQTMESRAHHMQQEHAHPAS